MIQANTIKVKIEQHLPGCMVYVDGEDGRHFTATVVSEQFMGKTRVQQQQMVYQTLQEVIQAGTLHALSLQTYTPTEWQAKIKCDNNG